MYSNESNISLSQTFLLLLLTPSMHAKGFNFSLLQTLVGPLKKV